MGFFRNILTRLSREKKNVEIHREWNQLMDFYRPYVPCDFKASTTRPILADVESELTYVKQEALALYPVLRFMCRDLHETLFKDRVLTADEALTFIMILDKEMIRPHIEKWRKDVIDAIIEHHYPSDKVLTDCEKLEKEKLKQQLSASRNLFAEMRNINAAFTPRYVTKALEDLEALDDLSW